MTSVSLRTAAWYGDKQLDLDFPDWCQVTTWRPATPRPLSDEQIRQALDRPVAAPTLSRLAAGKRRPVVIVDDTTRPTPAARVMPYILGELQQAGIPPHHVRVVVATGTHGPPGSEALRGKLGTDVLRSCSVHVHNDMQALVRLGRTSRGTPVYVDREVAAADLVVGVAGIYPQHTVGFGGGTKLVLGVLGRRSIAQLHYGHPSGGGTYDPDNEFRRDLDEIAEMVGLRWSVSLHVDADREIVRAVSGDPRSYHQGEVEFCLQAYSAPPPGDADVVIANAFPSDVSLTFVHSKGIIPLGKARPGASRICIATCPEGIGRHGLFPFVDIPRFRRERQLARKVLARPREVPVRAVRKLRRRVRSGRQPATGTSVRRPIWLYAPEGRLGGLPAAAPGMRMLTYWDDVLDAIATEQDTTKPLQVTVYPCAPLQVLGAATDRTPMREEARSG